ncbi:MAG: hypothetical protein IPP96_07115 [Chitinophagaceae bacterium]|nr:hypothetical protein [Chitinophagaceae bacterium]
MPLTADHAAAKMYLSSASPDGAHTETVIADALKMSYSAFGKEKNTGRLYNQRWRRS